MKRLTSFAVVLSSVFLAAPAVWAGCPYTPGAGGMAGCPHGSTGSVALYLVTLVVGYWALQLAEKEGNKNLKTLGRLVAAIVLVVSLFGLLCKAGAGWCRMKGSCGAKSGDAAMSAAPAAPATTEAPTENR